MNKEDEPDVQMIPVDQINVVNHRARAKRKFEEIVASIRKLGLKKPITVTPDLGNNGDPSYDLVCGEGRLEAFKILDQKEIPARIRAVSKEDLLLMSLVENLARRQYNSVELLKEIAALKERGYSATEIAAKTALHVTYIRDISRLLKKGEERLIQAVEKRRIPLKIAMTIAGSSDEAVQQALTEAYEKGELRGKAFLEARQLIEARRTKGRSIRKGVQSREADGVSADYIIRTYRQETARQKEVVKRAKLSETQLLIVISGLRRLFADENLVTLLCAESLDTLPQYLADQANRSEH